jgi:hypothetical protein
MARATFDYQRAVREVDKVLAENNAEIRADNWQQVALDWFTADERDRNELARYIAAHAGQLGVAWARDLVRLEVFFRANDHTAIITHYDRAMTRYPRCPLVEMWVAEQIGRHGGDWWRARPLLLYAVEQLPDYARPYYELGFMHNPSNPGCCTGYGTTQAPPYVKANGELQNQPDSESFGQPGPIAGPAGRKTSYMPKLELHHQSPRTRLLKYEVIFGQILRSVSNGQHCRRCGWSGQGPVSHPPEQVVGDVNELVK